MKFSMNKNTDDLNRLKLYNNYVVYFLKENKKHEVLHYFSINIR